jgi:hypothetical protein
MAKHLNRRAFLRGSGVCLALPLLDAMRPAFGAGASDKAVPRRMVAIETNMGILPQFFFPENAGSEYTASPYLERMAKHKQNMTVFSGVSLPGVTGGHVAEASENGALFLTSFQPAIHSSIDGVDHFSFRYRHL